MGGGPGRDGETGSSGLGLLSMRCLFYIQENMFTRQAVKYASLEIRGEKLALQILYIDGLLKEFMKSIDKRRGSKTESWRFQY